jgi:hypothetical protein
LLAVSRFCGAHVAATPHMSFPLSFPRYPGAPIALLFSPEGTMHIHGNSMNINATNFYSVGNGERSAATQRAAEVRKKLLKNAASVEASLEAGASPEESLLIGQWLDSRHSQVLSEDEYHTAASGKNLDFG